MSKLLIRTNSILTDCERHLAESKAFGTEIESYLTQFVLVVLCADVQQEVYRLTEERASIANDSALSSFVAATSRKVLRSVRKSEIAGYVEMFGSGCKAALDKRVDEAEAARYNNAVGFRHDVAHRQGTSISFSEVKAAVVAAEKLLQATAESIAHPNIPPASVSEALDPQLTNPVGR